MPGVRVDKRKALTLHEEEEHEEDEDVIRETAPLLTEGGMQPGRRERKEGRDEAGRITAGGSLSQTGPGPLLQQAAAAAEQRRRSVVMASELNEDHKWLMESLSGMDLSMPLHSSFLHPKECICSRDGGRHWSIEFIDSPFREVR